MKESVPGSDNTQGYGLGSQCVSRVELPSKSGALETVLISRHWKYMYRINSPASVGLRAVFKIIGPSAHESDWDLWGK